MSQMLKSSSAMGIATMTSRILGMVREIVYANFMGDTPTASAFKFAFQVPNLFRRLLGEGALSAAFIPIFKNKEKNEGQEKMWEATNAVMSALVSASSIIILIVVLGITVVLTFFGPTALHQTDQNNIASFISGLSQSMSPGIISHQTALMLRLLRLMFPYMLLVCIAAAFMGILNSRGYFFIPAMGATMLNIVMIASVVFLTPLFGTTLETKIFALAVGVLLAGLAQVFFQYPFLVKEGYRPKWINPWKNPVVKEVVTKMIPGTIGVAAFQINVLIINTIAFWVDPRIVASFDYAVRMMELPQGVFGISLATYLLPTLSGFAAEKNYQEYRNTLVQGLKYLFFANTPASVLLCVCSEPIIRLLFEHGRFDATSTERAAFALSCLAPGLIAFSSVNVLARAFYALGDTKTPMLTSSFCLCLNLFIAAWLIWPLKQGGLGIANSITSLINALLLAYALKRKLPKIDFSQLKSLALKLAIAGLACGGGAWSVQYTLTRIESGDSLLSKCINVFLPLSSGACVYLITAFALKIPQASEIINLIKESMIKIKRAFFN